MPKDLTPIAQRIKQLRVAKKYTQEELAQKSYTSLSLIRQIEQGIKLPSLSTLIEIANALEVSVEDILSDVVDSSISKQQAEYIELFSNCNHDEKEMLIRTLKFLKALFSEFGI